MKDVIVDPNKKDKITRFSVTKEERQRLEGIQGTMSILNLEREGLQSLLVRDLTKIRQRLNINEEDAPKGYERFIDIDSEKWEILVIDRPVLAPKEDTNTEVN